MSQIERVNPSEKESVENKDVQPHNEASLSSEESSASSTVESTLNADEEGCECEDSIDSIQSTEESMSTEESQENLAEASTDIAQEENSISSGNEKEHLQLLNILTIEMEKHSEPEAKLQTAIDFMEASLAQSGTPHFKTFWQARGICLQLFKENIPPNARTLLWAKYSELSKEARRLKEILDEQSAFAVEQIEIAIQALEADIESIAQITPDAEKVHEHPFSLSCKTLESQYPFYQAIQYELDLLNTQAARINGLRKELIKTEMRVRQKNKFFQRLSVAGDKVFPRRKELIKTISQQFIQDVDAFIADNFSRDDIQDSLFFLREEIKALQGTAKLLTLNTHSFNHTRMRLSECWDNVKGLEKERKKVRAQQKVLFKQSTDSVLDKIDEFNQQFQSNQLSTVDGNKKLDDIVTFMRSVELGRDELKFLRDQLNNARKALLEKVKQEEQERQNQENDKLRLKKQKLFDLKEEVETLLKTVQEYDADALIAQRDILIEKITSAPLIKTEKLELERLLKPLRDIISDKKEQALMTLSDDDRQAIQQLKTILKQRKERRQEIKNQLENLRKASGNSGLDFEQALVYNTQVIAEKERLEKINLGIAEVEQKIRELEKKN